MDEPQQQTEERTKALFRESGKGLVTNITSLNSATSLLPLATFSLRYPLKVVFTKCTDLMGFIAGNSLLLTHLIALVLSVLEQNGRNFSGMLLHMWHILCRIWKRMNISYVLAIETKKICSEVDAVHIAEPKLQSHREMSPKKTNVTESASVCDANNDRIWDWLRFHMRSASLRSKSNGLQIWDSKIHLMDRWRLSLQVSALGFYMLGLHIERKNFVALKYRRGNVYGI